MVIIYCVSLVGKKRNARAEIASEMINRNIGLEPRKLRTPKLSSQRIYLYLWTSGIALSACFPGAELQFLVLSVILGAKWIVEGRTDRINIILGGRQ